MSQINDNIKDGLEALVGYVDSKAPNIAAGNGINITGTTTKTISAVLPTSDPGVDNVLWLSTT